VIRGATALAAAWCLLGGAAACMGQDPEPVPPGTVILGPLQIRPSILLKDAGFDENVFNEPVDPKRDFTLTLVPSAEVRFRMRRLRLAYATTTEYVYYRTYKTERGTNMSSSVRLDLDLGVLKPYGSITGLNTKARLNNEIDQRARHRDLAYSAGVAVKVGSRTHLLFNGTQTTIEFEPDVEFRGVELGESFDGRKRGADVGMALALTPLTTFTLTLTREQQRFERSPGRDSNSWRVTPGFTFSPTGVITGGASVGYRRFEPVSPTLPGYSGLVSTVTVGVTLYDRHHVQTVFNRDVQYSYETANTYYLATGGMVTWTLPVIGPVDVRATAGRHLMDYTRVDAGAGRDTLTTYGAGAGYRFSNRARFGLNAEWSRRDSNRSAERGYRNHRIFAGLTWGTS
jgi:hypothetical protein